MAIDSEKIEFENAEGHALAARLDRPAGEPKAVALFAHCFTCSKEIKAAARISRALAGRGIAVLRFDFTGLGHSEGEFENTNFSSNIADLVSAADFLRDRLSAPSILVGHSLGGAAVLAAASQIPETVAVATVNSPFEPDNIRRHFGGSIDAIEERGGAEVHIGNRPFTVTRQFLEDIAAHKMEEHIAGLRRALLVFHAPTDEVVSVDNARKIFTAAKHPKSFVSLDGADHMLSGSQDGEYVGAVLAAWAARYLELDDSSAEKVGDLPRDVVVTESGSGRFTQSIRAGKHALLSDEPESVGGTDAGPSPYDLLMMALGSCTSMTLRMYADVKKWPLEQVRVRLTHGKIHARDCAQCETKEGKIDRIERSIEMRGNLDDSQRERLIEIADRCPVHRTLHSEVWVETTEDREE